MKISMEFIREKLEHDGLTLTSRGGKNPMLREVRLFTPGEKIRRQTLYFCLPEAEAEAVCTVASEKNTAIVWTGEERLCPEGVSALVGTGEDTLSLYNRVAEVFRFFNDWESRVFGAMVDNRPLEELCAYLNEVTPNPWYISDASYRMLAIKKDQDAEDMSVIWRFQYREKHLPIDVVLSLVEDGKLEEMNNQRAAFISRKLEPFVIPYVSKTIFLPTGILGHFHIVGFYTRLGSYEREIAEVFGNMIARVCASNPAYLPTSGRFFDNYFMDLLEGKEPALAEMMEEIFHRFGWDVDDRFALVVLRKPGSGTLAQTARSLEIQVLERIHGCRCLQYRDQVVALVDLTRRGRRNAAMTDTDLRRGVEDMLRDFGGNAGISECFSGRKAMENLGFYYKQASVALGYAAAEDAMTYYMYDQVAIRHAGDALLTSGHDSFLYHPALQLLRSYDRENDTALYDTLRLYLLNEQNTMETARQLFVHRNTLLHRLQKITDLTGLDLTVPDVRLRLILSFVVDDRRSMGTVHSDKE